jgi:hypothetical protein
MFRKLRFQMIDDNVETVNHFVTSLGRQFFLQGTMRNRYQKLVLQLENVRRMISKPEAYF